MNSQHTVVDDLQAGAAAVVLASLGLSMLHSAGLVTGGTPGLAFLLSYATGLPLGLALFLVNLPFYLLAWRGLGARFTFKTLAAVTALSLGVELVAGVLAVRAEPAYAALAGGVLIGMALLVMFRHKASFGGINILVLYLQRRQGWPVGKTQLVIDCAILVLSLAVITPVQVLWSLLCAAVVNTILICNHKPGRYLPSAQA